MTTDPLDPTPAQVDAWEAAQPPAGHFTSQDDVPAGHLDALTDAAHAMMANPGPDYGWAAAPVAQTAVFAVPDPEALDAMDTLQSQVGFLLSDLAQGLPGALAEMDATNTDVGVVPFVAWCQAQRAVLAEMERLATKFGGTSPTIGKTGTLPDGRRYTVRRGSNRKAWDHTAWKHDARAAVLGDHNLPAELVNPDSGELVNVLGILAEVQEVAGSTGPRISALKALALDPDDYCTTEPGSWGVVFDTVEP